MPRAHQSVTSGLSGTSAHIVNTIAVFWVPHVGVCITIVVILNVIRENGGSIMEKKMGVMGQ